MGHVAFLVDSADLDEEEKAEKKQKIFTIVQSDFVIM